MQNNSIQQETLSWLIQNISNQIWVQRATVAKVVTINFAQKLFPSYIYFWWCQSQSFNLKHQWMSNIVAKLQLQFLSRYDMTLGAGPPDKTIWEIEFWFQIILLYLGPDGMIFADILAAGWLYWPLKVSLISPPWLFCIPRQHRIEDPIVLGRKSRAVILTAVNLSARTGCG